MPGSYAWNRCRKGRDEEEALVVMSPYLDALYDHLNDLYFDGELVDIPIVGGTAPTVAKFRVLVMSLEYKGLHGLTTSYGVIYLDWDVLTPTRIERMMLHEMNHVLGIKRGVGALGLHKTEFIAELRKLYERGAGKWADREAIMYKYRLEDPELDKEVYERWRVGAGLP